MSMQNNKSHGESEKSSPDQRREDEGKDSDVQNISANKANEPQRVEERSLYSKRHPASQTAPEEYASFGSVPYKRVQKSASAEQENQSGQPSTLYNIMQTFNCMKTNLFSQSTVDSEGNLTERLHSSQPSNFPVSKYSMNPSSMEDYKQQIMKGTDTPIRIIHSRTNELRLIDPSILQMDEQPHKPQAQADTLPEMEIETQKETKKSIVRPLRNRTEIILVEDPDDDFDLEGTEESDDEDEYEFGQYMSDDYISNSDEDDEEDDVGVDEVFTFFGNDGSFINRMSSEEGSISHMSKLSKDSTKYTWTLFSSAEGSPFKEIWDKESPFSEQQDIDKLCEHESCTKCVTRLIA